MREPVAAHVVGDFGKPECGEPLEPDQYLPVKQSLARTEESQGCDAESSLLAQALKKSGGARTRAQWARQLDALLHHRRTQSVKNTDTARNKGYDAGKKVSGNKRHIAVDTQGLPHAIWVTTAEVADRAGALAMLGRHQCALSRVVKVMADAAYTGAPFAEGVKQLLVEIVKSDPWLAETRIPERVPCRARRFDHTKSTRAQ